MTAGETAGTDNMTTQEAILREAARTVAERHGYRRTDLETAIFSDFKVKWVRTVDSISFTVSDYLLGMPGETAEGLFETLFRKIAGEDAGYPDDVTAWLTDPSFAEEHADAWMRRARGCPSPDAERIRDDLVARGYLPAEPRVRLCAGYVRMPRASLLMRCAVVPQEALDEGGRTAEEMVWLACRQAGAEFGRPVDAGRIGEEMEALFGH